MDSQHEHFLLHAEVRWLSRGRVLLHFFELCKKTKIFFGKMNFPLAAFSPVALQLRAPPKVSARAPAHRSYHFRGVKLKSCIKKIHHNLYISKQANVRIKHADTEGASHKKFGTDARVQ